MPREREPPKDLLNEAVEASFCDPFEEAEEFLYQIGNPKSLTD